MKLNTVLVVDTETGSIDVMEESCELLQIATLAMDPITGETLQGSEFCEYVKPVDFANLTDEAMGVNKIPLDVLHKAPDREVVLSKFVQHVRAYNPKGKSLFTAPHAAGKNIRNFDLPLLNRLFKKVKGATDGKGKPNVFDWRIQIDIEDDIVRWLVLSGKLESISMDSLRPYFGLSAEKGHDALEDVRQEARILKSFFQLYAQLAPKIDFRGSLSPRS